MSLTGNMFVFTQNHERPQESTVAQLLYTLGCVRIQTVWLANRPEYLWTEALLDWEFDEADNPHELPLPPEPVTQRDTVATDCTPSEAVALLGDHGLYTLELEAPSLSAEVFHALSTIPKSVRCNFVPNSPTVLIGQHDIFDFVDDKPVLFGHTGLSISFFGYGVPCDWPEYRRLLSEHPYLLELRRRLEPITGPLDVAVVWST